MSDTVSCGDKATVQAPTTLLQWTGHLNCRIAGPAAGGEQTWLLAQQALLHAAGGDQSADQQDCAVASGRVRHR